MNSQQPKKLSLKQQFDNLKEENESFRKSFEEFILKIVESSKAIIKRHDHLHKEICGYALNNHDVLIKAHRQILNLEKIKKTNQESKPESYIQLQQELDKLMGQKSRLKKQYENFRQEVKEWNEKVLDQNNKLSNRLNNLEKSVTGKKTKKENSNQQSNDYQSNSSVAFWKKISNIQLPIFNIGRV